MKKIKYIASAFMLSFMITSCEMERFPYDVIETSQSFESVKDAKNWDNIFYTQLRSRYYGAYTYTTDVQADQLNATKDYGNRNGAPHRWDFLADDYSIRDVWAGYYSALNNINTAIEGFKTITPADAAEQKLLDQYVGDAHLARAYYYLNLVLRWAKPYNATTAGTDLGVPLVLVSELNGLPARATVQKTYDQILADIQVAKTNLGSLVGQAGATRFNMDVVTALEARVKLYMNDYEGAALAAQEVISNTEGYKLETTYKDVFTKTYNSSESIFAIYHTQTPEGGSGMYQVNRTKYSETLKTLADSQIGGVGSLSGTGNGYDPRFSYAYSENSKGPNLNGKYPANTFAANTENCTLYYLRLSEIYLIHAEAEVRTVGGNLNNALASLNAIRVRAGVATFPLTDKATLLTQIREEKLLELFFENGETWFDLVRYHTLGDVSAFVEKPSLTSTNQFIFPMPLNVLTANTLLVQNPGY